MALISLASKCDRLVRPFQQQSPSNDEPANEAFRHLIAKLPNKWKDSSSYDTYEEWCERNDQSQLLSSLINYLCNKLRFIAMNQACKLVQLDANGQHNYCHYQHSIDICPIILVSYCKKCFKFGKCLFFCLRISFLNFSFTHTHSSIHLLTYRSHR